MTIRNALVVEDASDSALLLQRVLKMLGFESWVAPDSRTALALATQFAPKLVFLDIGLPDMNGYELVKCLRALPGCKTATMVAVSGFAPPDNPDELKRLGFDHYLTKPLSIPALRSWIAGRFSLPDPPAFGASRSQSEQHRE